MTSIEIADTTAAVLRSQSARAGISVESLHRHSEVLDEQFHADAEAERIAG